MSRILTSKLHDELTKKRQKYAVRITCYVKGALKARFLDDCIKRELSESKTAAQALDAYYSIIDRFPDLKDKEPNAIKKFIIDRIKFD